MSGFFTGLKISLIRDVPFSGIFYPIYKTCQTFYSNLLGNFMDDKTSTHTVAVSALSVLSANVFSCTFTHPIDLIRTRVYFQYYNKDEAQQYNGIKDAIYKIYENDGAMGYFRGLFPRILRKGFGSILAWGMYEYLIDKKDALIKID